MTEELSIIESDIGPVIPVDEVARLKEALEESKIRIKAARDYADACESRVRDLEKLVEMQKATIDAQGKELKNVGDALRSAFGFQYQ